VGLGVAEASLELAVLGEQALDGLEHDGRSLVGWCWGGKVRENDRADPRNGGRRGEAGYLESAAAFFLYRASKRATRPPVSRIFCLPV
jgi:hypothetical protein